MLLSIYFANESTSYLAYLFVYENVNYVMTSALYSKQKTFLRHFHETLFVASVFGWWGSTNVFALFVFILYIILLDHLSSFHCFDNSLTSSEYFVIMI